MTTLLITIAILLAAGQVYAFGSGADQYRLANTPMVAEVFTSKTLAI